jgi:excisionase family DNA binding protein
MPYSLSDAADKLDVSAVTVRRLIKRGEISFTRIGKNYCLTDEQIDSYLAKKSASHSVHKDSDVAVKKANASIPVPNEIISELESEMGDLSHGIVKLSLHIRYGLIHRYTIARERSEFEVINKEQHRAHEKV